MPNLFKSFTTKVGSNIPASTSSPGNTGNNPPPNNTVNNPSHDSGTSNAVPGNILTFRTITTVLSYIQFNKNFEIQRTPYDALETNDLRRKEIKICSAFATLAVMDAEVIAAVTKPTQQATEVIEPLNAAEAKGFLGSLYNYFTFTKNPERDDPNPPVNISLEDVDIKLCPELTEGASDQAIKGYTDTYWKIPSLARHLFILTRLLTMKDESNPKTEMNHNTRIFCYVAGTCFPKMLRRFQNKPVSIPYYNALIEISSNVIDFNPSVTKISITDGGIEGEKQFLKSFVLPFASKIGINCPRIMEQAKLAAAGQPFELYTEETYKEFHILLVYVLRAFRASLELLKDSKCTADSAPIPPKFRRAQLAAALNGFAILKLVESNALRMHLRNIQVLLLSGIKKYREEELPQEEEIPKEGEVPWEGEIPEKIEELDDELQAVDLFVRKAGVVSDLVTTYLDWMKLTVTHFDAIRIILTFVNGRYFQGTTISTKLLAIPSIDTKQAAPVKPVKGQASQQLSQMPWEDFFVDSGLFPVTDDETNAEIRAFLEETVGTAKIIDSAAKRWLARVPMYTRIRKMGQKDERPNRSQQVVDDLISDFTDLKIQRLPSKIERGKNVALLLQQLKQIRDRKPWKEPTGETPECTEILKLLKALQKDIRFFIVLAVPEFKGTLHCEACLASFMCPQVRNSEVKHIWQRMEGFRSNIGVSKYCCPVCSKLLTLLNPNAIVKGSHNTVSACSLPTWLPAGVVDSMNKYFAEQMKEALSRIMNDPDAGRVRTKSTGSHRLSQDSADGAGAFPPTFTDTEYDDMIAIGRSIDIIPK